MENIQYDAHVQEYYKHLHEQQHAKTKKLSKRNIGLRKRQLSGIVYDIKKNKVSIFRSLDRASKVRDDIIEQTNRPNDIVAMSLSDALEKGIITYGFLLKNFDKKL